MEISVFEVDPNSIVYQDVIRLKKRIAVILLFLVYYKVSIQFSGSEKHKYTNIGYLQASRSFNGKAQVLFHLLFARFYKINQISSN